MGVVEEVMEERAAMGAGPEGKGREVAEEVTKAVRCTAHATTLQLRLHWRCSR